MTNWDKAVEAAKFCKSHGPSECPECPLYRSHLTCFTDFKNAILERATENTTSETRKPAQGAEWVEFKRSYDDAPIRIHAPSVQSVTKCDNEIDLGMDNGTDMFVAGTYDEVLCKLGIEGRDESRSPD